MEINPKQLAAFMRQKPTLADTAAFFECSERTIERYIRENFNLTFVEFREQKMVHTRHGLIRKALEMAMSGDRTMLIFSLKNLCGWSDKQELIASENGLNITMNYERKRNQRLMSELYSKPNFADFSPRVIPYQSDVIDFLDEWDFSTGTPEVLLSGSVGSAKSILMAHLIVRHCLENPGARVCLARKALPDLKDTIFKEVLEHISEDFTEGKHYWVNNSSAKINWFNGSEIISRSWADKKYKKARSLKLSMVVFEELTENNDDDKEAFDTLKARLRRIPTVKENILIAATNPDSPGHWVHKYFIDSDKRTRKVFYSVTTDNPFLDPVYIEQLKQDYDPKMARRMLYGEWLEINEERVYHSYDADKNFVKVPYQINNHYPIILAFDFNIGAGKPMSSCAKQWDGRSFHIFDEVIVQGARTEEVADEWIEKGIVKQGQRIIIRGDASGDAKDTRSKLSDYDILRKKFVAVGAIVEFQVPRANPPVRRRHNLVNAYCLNDQGAIRLFVYEKAKTCHEGMRLTALKKGGDYIEDDSKPYQHVTTAIGYSVVYQHNLINTNQVYSSGR